MFKRAFLIEKLQSRGYRATEERRKIMDAISIYRAVKVSEVAKISELDRVTVHRNLELMEKENFLHKSPSHSAYFFCTIDDDEICHMAIICKKCKMVEERALEEHKHPNSKKFKIPRQIHELSALCNNCS